MTSTVKKFWWEGDEFRALVPLKRLMALYDDPIMFPPWRDMNTPISVADVLTVETFTDTSPYRENNPKPYRWHVERIAYFVMHGWNIPVEMEVTQSGEVLIHDGHHRLAASLIRGDRVLYVNVSGFLEQANRRFRWMPVKAFQRVFM